MDHKLYLSDPGIYKKGNKFYFNKNNSQVTDPGVLKKLKAIYIPPAWTSVWYASKQRCHILAHGIDTGGKKQYILSERWTQNAKYEKYNRMKSFIRDVPAFKKKVNLSDFSVNYENVVKLLFNLLIDTHIRVGNEKYTPHSYGLTTLRQKHFIQSPSGYRFSFVGKSKKNWDLDVPEEYIPFLKKLVLPDPKKSLFWYRNGKKMSEISSEELNDYLKEHMGKKYTCKDFRTYSANILFIKSFLKKSKTSSGSPKKIVLESIDESAGYLGHSRGISKKSYISENLLDFCVDHYSKAAGSSVGELLAKVWS